MAQGSEPPGVAEPCPEPALITRTSRELLGDRALPTVLRDRPVIFVMGAHGSGKSTVAQRLLPPAAHAVDGDGLRRAANLAGRNRRWSETFTDSPGLLLDGVDSLHRRYGVIRLLGELLRGRAEAGRRTVIIAGPVDTSISLLYPELPCELGASLLLRFPVGKGRKRLVAERCAARGIELEKGAPAAQLEPWSYDAVERFLDQLG